MHAYKVSQLSYFKNSFLNILPGIPENEFCFPGKSGISREKNFREIRETLISSFWHKYCKIYYRALLVQWYQQDSAPAYTI